MRKYPLINRRSQLRIWLNKNQYRFISNEELTLLEESEFCEVYIEPCKSSFYSNHTFRVEVIFLPFGDVNDKWSGTYIFKILEGELL